MRADVTDISFILLLMGVVLLTAVPSRGQGTTPQKTALIVVDMQNDFLSEGGALYNPAGREVIPNVVRLVERAREEGMPVIFTQDWHRKNDPEFKIWGPHAVEGSKGAEFIPELAPREDEYIIRKRTYNAFFGTDLDMLLKDLGMERLLISGTVSNICVLNTAGDAALRGYKLVMVRDAMIPLNRFDQQAALREASFLYRGVITDVDHAFDPEPAPQEFATDAPPPDVETTPEAKLDAQKTALIVVDMQNDFAREGGSLYVPDTKGTVEPIRRLIEKARAAGAMVIFTQDWHLPDDAEFKIWPRHAVRGTEGAEVIAELNPKPDDYYIKKRTYDAFYGTDMDLLLRQHGIENVVVVGTVSNICVLHTAGKARLHGYNVYVARDGISSLTDFDQALALRQISFLYSGVISTSDGINFQ